MKCELIDHMGSDLTVVNAARVSMDKESDWERISVSEFIGDRCYETYDKLNISDKDRKLIGYLANHNHFTPFTHAQITLRETVPIFVARQRFKHTVGFTYNEVSRRYVDDTPEFYTPDVWRSRPEGSVKQGSGGALLEQEELNDAYIYAISACEAIYKELLNKGVAPEQARMVLPQSMYTSYYVTGSLYAFARAYNLRADPHAQKEIRDVADMWNEIIAPLFPASWEALTRNN